MVLPFSLTDAVLNPNSEDNIELLQPFDRVVILPQVSANGVDIIGVDPSDLDDPSLGKQNEAFTPCTDRYKA